MRVVDMESEEIAAEAACALAKNIRNAKLRKGHGLTQGWSWRSVAFSPGRELEAINILVEDVKRRGLKQFRTPPKPSPVAGAQCIIGAVGSEGHIPVRLISQYDIGTDKMRYHLSVLGAPYPLKQASR